MKTNLPNYNNIKDWDINESIYIDSGGYTFSFLVNKNILKLETGFNGYSHTINYFYFTQEMNESFIQQLEKLYLILQDSDAQKMKGFCSSVLPIETSETTIIFAEEVLTFKNRLSMVQLGAIWNIEIVQELISLFKSILTIQKVDKPVLHKKTDALLVSMATRYRQDFGLLENSEKVMVLLKMENIYDFYQTGMNAINISNALNINKDSIKQILEEINGKGFYHIN